MKKVIKLIILFFFVLIINSSCKEIFGGSPCEKHKDVYTYQFDTGSQDLRTKRTIEVLYNIVTNPNFNNALNNYNYFEVHGAGNLIVNYNPKKELLFVRDTDGGTDWQHVYPNITIENLKNFKIPDYFEAKGSSETYVMLIDSTFKKEINFTKIKEARTFLVTNLCK